MLLKGWRFAFNKKPWQSAVLAVIDKLCVWVTGQGSLFVLGAGRGYAKGAWLSSVGTEALGSVFA